MKARSLFRTLQDEAVKDYACSFQGSTGGFTRFKKRFSLHNIYVIGKAASTDTKAANKLMDMLDELISEDGYLPEQIFNVDERIPNHTYIYKESKSMPNFKRYKDRLTLLLGRSVAGFKLRSFMVYHSENPNTFKNINSTHCLSTTVPILKSG